MELFAETNAKLANTQQWRKEALCGRSVLAPWFTADIIPVDVRRELRALCDRCPVKAECEQTALSPKATAGFWAGRSYNQWGGTRD